MPLTISGVPIGVLDFGLVPASSSIEATLAATIRTAQLCDELGFSSYWLAEHHAHNTAWGDPVPLLALIAVCTERIRVGTGGSLVAMHEPPSLASNIQMLARLFPTRIDLGLVRGIPASSALRTALGITKVPDVSDHARRVGEILDALSSVNRHAPVGLPRGADPECWILGGGSLESALLAASVGAPYMLSFFHQENASDQPLAEYRGRFRSGFGVRPQTGVAVAGLCGDTEQEAAQLVAGRVLPGNVWPTIVGDALTCRRTLEAVVSGRDIDRLVFFDVSGDTESRVRSLRNLAVACDTAP